MRFRLPAKSQAALVAAILAVLLAARPAVAVGAPEAPAQDGAAAPANIQKQAINRKPAGANQPRATTQKTSAATMSAAAAKPALDPARVAWALGVVLVLILLARWVAKRFFGVTGTARGTRAVQVLSRSPISPRQQLVVIRVGRRLIVAADGGGQMNTLSEITDADEVAALIGQVQEDHNGRAGHSFGNLFGKMRGKYDADGDGRGPDDDRDVTPGPTHGVQGRLFARDDSDDTVAAPSRDEISGLMDKIRVLSRQFKA